jgi:hypothetical protein
LSLDCKATVNLGEFSRSGVTRGENQALDHDFGSQEKYIPFGIVDEDSAQLYLLFGSSYRTHLTSFHSLANRFTISRMKHRSILALAASNVHSKFLTRFLHLSIQALERSITHLVATGTNPDLPCAAFSALDGFGESSSLIFVIISG